MHTPSGYICENGHGGAPALPPLPQGGGSDDDIPF